MVFDNYKQLNQMDTGWEWVRLGEITRFINGDRGKNYPNRSEYVTTGIPFINAGHILPSGRLSVDSMHYISHEKYDLLRSGKITKGDLIYCLRGALGKTAIIKELTEGAIASSLVIIRPNAEIDPGFLYFFLVSPLGKSEIQKYDNGTAQPNLSAKNVKKYLVPLATLAEQRRIVAEIEKQFTRLDQAVASLKRAQANLARYKASVLKAACEGRLVPQDPDDEPAAKLLARILAERRQRWQDQEWQKLIVKAQKKAAQARRKAASRPARLSDLQPEEWQELSEAEYAHYLPKNDKWKEKYKEPVGVETAELPELPNGWDWINLDVISKKITDGEHFRPKTIESGVFFLSAKDVREQGVTFNDPLYVSQEDAVRFRQRCDPDPNDILIVSRGATVGRSCIVQTHELFCLLGSVILIKPVLDIEAQYLLNAIRSPSIHKKLVSLSGSTAQQAIYIRDIRNALVPIPPLLEQRKIVNELERRLSIVAANEKTITTNLARAERLRQSILQQAFSGRLVRPQRSSSTSEVWTGPTDEPPGAHPCPPPTN